MMERLDRVVSSVASRDLDVAARALCTIGDVLASFPNTSNYLRSGASRNGDWAQALAMLASARSARQMALAVQAVCIVSSEMIERLPLPY